MISKELYNRLQRTYIWEKPDYSCRSWRIDSLYNLRLIRKILRDFKKLKPEDQEIRAKSYYVCKNLNPLGFFSKTYAGAMFDKLIFEECHYSNTLNKCNRYKEQEREENYWIEYYKKEINNRLYSHKTRKVSQESIYQTFKWHYSNKRKDILKSFDLKIEVFYKKISDHYKHKGIMCLKDATSQKARDKAGNHIEYNIQVELEKLEESIIYLFYRRQQKRNLASKKREEKMQKSVFKKAYTQINALKKLEAELCQ